MELVCVRNIGNNTDDDDSDTKKKMIPIETPYKTYINIKIGEMKLRLANDYRFHVERYTGKKGTFLRNKKTNELLYPDEEGYVMIQNDGEYEMMDRVKMGITKKNDKKIKNIITYKEHNNNKSEKKQDDGDFWKAFAYFCRDYKKEHNIRGKANREELKKAWKALNKTNKETYFQINKKETKTKSNYVNPLEKDRKRKKK